MRWRRIAIPLGVATLLLVVTGVAYAVEQPDPTDPDFLNPTSTAPVGGRRLADALRAQGISVQRETRTSDALIAAHGGDATLFVTVPAVVQPDYLRMLSLMPASTRVVLVDPSGRVLDASEVPLATGSRRWATRAVGPQTGGGPCGLAEARRAGVAAALRQRYAGTEADRCYGGGLVRLPLSRTELVVIGASDPFRNDRIGEHGNEALAIGVLGTRSRVVWLDLHRLEPPPGVVDGPVISEAPPSLAADPQGRADDPGRSDGGNGSEGGSDSGSGDGEAPSEADGPNPLWNAFPPWFWAVLVQLALAALIFALWRARRLGPPVSEPLPVTVRAAETVVGRGRLYRRAKARGPAADILRAAARERIGPLMGPAQDASLVEAVAAQTGRDRDEVDALLYGAAPDTDDDLRRLAADLDTLIDALRRTP